MTIGVRKLFIDLGAERLLAAEKGKNKIAIEIKNFLNIFLVRELELSLGQYSIFKKLEE